MTIEFDKHFEKQVSKFKDTRIKDSIAQVVKSVIEAQKLTDIPNLKKLTGHHNAYRIRSGDYRIGFYFENEVVIFTVIAHRKDIYKTFP